MRIDNVIVASDVPALLQCGIKLAIATSSNKHNIQLLDCNACNTHTHIYIYTHIHIYIYIYIYIYTYTHTHQKNG